MNPRESRYVNVARIAYHLTQKALPHASHPKRPHHDTLPQVAACVLLMVSRDLSSSDMAAWLSATHPVRQAVDLPNVPDHTTLQRTCTKVRMVNGEQMKNQLLDAQGGDDEDVAADRTGCSPGQASRYDLTRTGRRSQQWAKGGSCGRHAVAGDPGLAFGLGGGQRWARVARPAARCPPRWTLPEQANSVGHDRRCGR